MFDQPAIQALYHKRANLQRALTRYSVSSDLDASMMLEHSRALDELENLWADPNELESNLKTWLAQRWERIGNSALSYTQQPDDPMNRLCLSIAKQLSPLPNNPEALDRLPPQVGPYFLLMPSLKASFDTAGNNIHRYALHQFVLSDDKTVFIPIVPCLECAHASDDGILKQVVAQDAYGLQIVAARPADAEIPDLKLVVYWQDGAIHCAAKNQEPFELTKDAIMPGLKRSITLEDRELTPEEQNKCDQSYSEIIQVLMPPAAKQLRLSVKNDSLFCRMLSPGGQAPVPLSFENSAFGEQAEAIKTAMNDQPAPYLVLQGGALVCKVRSATGDIPLNEALLTEANAAALKNYLCAPAKKQFNHQQESIIFQALASKSYQREHQAFPPLTETDKRRVRHHSKLAEDFSKRIDLRHEDKDSLGGQLKTLRTALIAGRSGGFAKPVAYEGVAKFNEEYWNHFNPIEKEILFNRFRGLRNIIQRIQPTRGIDGPCVEITSGYIQDLLDYYPSIYSGGEIMSLMENTAQKQLKADVQKANYPLQLHSDPPDLAVFFKHLSRESFHRPEVKQALLHTLDHQPKLNDEVLRAVLLLDEPEQQVFFNRCDPQGNTVLMRAMASQDPELVGKIIEATPSDRINARNKLGQTALMMLANHPSHTETETIATQLLNQGANQYLQDNQGCSVLLPAFKHKNIPLLRVLFKQREAIDGLDKFLMRAARHNNSDRIDTLLELGADPNATNDEGDTAYTEALVKKHFKVTALLLKVTANPDHQGPKVETLEPSKNSVRVFCAEALRGEQITREEQTVLMANLEQRPLNDQATYYQKVLSYAALSHDAGGIFFKFNQNTATTPVAGFCQ